MVCRNPKCETNAAGTSGVVHRKKNPVKCPRCWWPYRAIAEVSGCPKCGGIGGVHQRGCRKAMG